MNSMQFRDFETRFWCRFHIFTPSTRTHSPGYECTRPDLTVTSTLAQYQPASATSILNPANRKGKKVQA